MILVTISDITIVIIRSSNGKRNEPLLLGQ